jgi:hypothetical protein
MVQALLPDCVATTPAGTLWYQPDGTILRCVPTVGWVAHDERWEPNPGGPAIVGPEIEPPLNVAPHCIATWVLFVWKAVDGVRTLKMEFGDGSYATRVIPQSSGPTDRVATFSFTHEFPARVLVEVLQQRATIVETGASSVSYTVHPDPFGGCGTTCLDQPFAAPDGRSEEPAAAMSCG